MIRTSLVIKRNRSNEVIANVRAGVGNAVRRITLDLLSQAVMRAPVEEGTLRGSGSAHFDGGRIATGADVDPTAEGNEALEGGAESGPTTGVVAFNAVYAAAQHERTDYHHPKGGEAKYLERPLEENRTLYKRTIAEAARDAAKH
jgi:hypothetical protein